MKMKMKTGHYKIESTLRPEEVDVLDNMVEEMEYDRRKRCLNPETYHPTDATKVTRAGLIRAAVRYVMEHRDDFEEWLVSDKDTV